MNSMFQSIPTVDLADFISGDSAKRKAFIENIGKACEVVGFVTVRNPGLTPELQENLYASIKRFFALEDAVKEAYEYPEIMYQRGYTGRDKEHAKDHPTPDMKEFFHIGQEFSEEEAAKDALLQSYPRNPVVKEVDDFMPLCIETFKILENAGNQLLEALALYLGLEGDYFAEKVKYGNSILRPIHYYPIENPSLIPPDAVRAAAHGDINLITLLMGASAEGLQVLRLDGAWIPVKADADQVVVNVGDMLSRLTNNRLKSTIHRVVNPPLELMNTPRYSIPFFMHPRGEMDLSCLNNCISDEYPKLYEDITAGEFLHQRLAEIGLSAKK